MKNAHRPSEEISHMFDPSTSLEDNPHRIIDFFKILAQPAVLKWLFNDLHRFAQQSGTLMDRFPELFTTVARYFNFSQTLVTALVKDSLKGLSGPELMFRGDHMRMRLLREFITQGLGSTLTSHLEPLVKTLAVSSLCEVDLSQTGQHFIDRLLSFRFPSEFNACFGIISRTISQKFPERERVALSILFFLRYLFPLILNSPEHFHLEMTPEYQVNSLQLIKRIQPLAIGEFPSDLYPHDSAPHREAMDDFFSRFLSTVASPRSFVLCTLVPPAEAMRDFLELLDGFSLSPIAQSGLASLPGSISEQWSCFFTNHHRFLPSHPSGQRIPSCSSSPLPHRSRRRSYFNRLSKASGSETRSGTIQADVHSPHDGKPSKSFTHFSLTNQAATLTMRTGRSRSDTSLDAEYDSPLPLLVNHHCSSVADQRLIWEVKSFSLTAIFKRLADCFCNPTTALMFELEVHYLICCHSLFINFDDLLDYLLNQYISEVCSPTFVAALFGIWIACDPRLAAARLRIAPHLSGNDPRFSMTLIIQDLKQEICLPMISVSERRDLRKLLLKMDPSRAAKHLQDVHMYFYQKVYPWDVIGSLKNKPGSVCGQVAAHFNSTVAWIHTICLQPGDEKSRAKRLSRWIAIGHACYVAGFLSPLLMIQTALSNQVISRLRSTWNRVPQVLLEHFEEIQKVCSPAHNYVTLRNLATTLGVTLPLAITSRDIATVMELVKAHGEISAESIPYDRCRHVGVLAHRAGLLRSVRTSETEHSQLFELLCDPVPRFGEDKLYQLSYLHEPPLHGSVETPVRTPNPLQARSGRLRSVSSADIDTH